MPNTPISKIVTSSIGRGAELQYGPGNNQYARASDLNPLITAFNNFSLANSINTQVTQATSLSTGVTLNGMTGVINCSVAAGLASGSTATFTLTNSSIISSSVIFAVATCATASTAIVVAANPASAGGSATVSLYNPSSTATGTTNPIKIYFVIL